MNFLASLHHQASHILNLVSALSDDESAFSLPLALDCVQNNFSVEMIHESQLQPTNENEKFPLISQLSGIARTCREFSQKAQKAASSYVCACVFVCVSLEKKMGKLAKVID